MTAPRPCFFRLGPEETQVMYGQLRRSRELFFPKAHTAPAPPPLPAPPATQSAVRESCGCPDLPLPPRRHPSPHTALRTSERKKRGASESGRRLRIAYQPERRSGPKKTSGDWKPRRKRENHQRTMQSSTLIVYSLFYLSTSLPPSSLLTEH